MNPLQRTFICIRKKNEHREFGEYLTQRLLLDAWYKLERGGAH